MQLTTSYQNTSLLNLQSKFCFFEVRDASAVLSASCSKEWDEFVEILEKFTFSGDVLLAKGGNKSALVSELESLFYKKGWMETRVDSEQILYELPKTGRLSGEKNKILKISGKNKKFPITGKTSSLQTIERINLLTKKFPEARITSTYQEGYQVDCLKGRVAIDIEWNAKDGNLDRDLSAYRAWYDFGLIDGAILITKDITECRKLIHDLWQDYLCTNNLPKNTLPPVDLKTSTTTSSDKAVERIKRGDAGGCPVLIVGIQRGCWDGSPYSPKK